MTSVRITDLTSAVALDGTEVTEIVQSGVSKQASVNQIANYTTNQQAINAVLTGYTSGAGIISASDTILTAIQKLNGNTGALITGVSSVYGRTGAITANAGDYTTSLVTEGSNLYYTNARAIAAPITGYVSGAGTVAATDTILQAINKLNGNIALKANIASPQFTGTVVVGAGTAFGETLEAIGGRLALQDGGGTSRKALIVSNPGYGGLGYSRLQSFDYGTAAALPLVINDAGGVVSFGTSNGIAQGCQLNVNAGVQIVGTYPRLQLYDTNGGADAKYYSVVYDNGDLLFAKINDAYTVATEQMRLSGIGLGIGLTATALLDLAASTTARSQFRLRSGAAPTSPNDGDIWYDGTNLKMRVGAVTKTFTLI